MPTGYRMMPYMPRAINNVDPGVGTPPPVSQYPTMPNQGIDYSRLFPSINPVAPIPATPQGPQFGDITSTLNKPLDYYGNPLSPINRSFAGNDTFQQGQDLLTPDFGISPDTQKILDYIRSQGDIARTKGTSEAQALAIRRGLGGSSTEQYGTAEAGNLAEQNTQGQQTAVLLQNLQRQQAAKDLAAQGLFNRSNQEAQYGRDYNIQEYTAEGDRQKALADLQNQRVLEGAKLTSDEIASLRNQDYSNRYLELQKQLGEQANSIAQDNIGAQKDIANQNGRNQLIGTGIGAVAPWALNKLWPTAAGGGAGGAGVGEGAAGAGAGFLAGFGGTSLLSNLAGGGTTPLGQAISGAGPSGIPLATAGQNPFVAGGVGGAIAGTGAGYLGTRLGRAAFGGGNDLGGTAGAGIGYAFGGPIGAGVGGFVGTGAQRIGENVDKQVTEHLGNTAGSMLRPFVNPVAAAKNLASNPKKAVESVTKSVGNSVKKVFPF